MDNTDNFSSSILQSSESSSFPSITSGESSGFFDWLKSINLTTWIIIILILAFFGFNIFFYLAKGTKDITGVFSPLINKIAETTALLTGQVVNVSAQGAKAVVSGSSDTINTGLTEIQNITPQGAPTSLKSHTIQQEQSDITSNNALNRTLDDSQQGNYNYEANEASSSLQSGGKSGWCYIGEDRGNRSCAPVGENDKCMSGDIFPTQNVCINPNLRS
jgi:hypothetical protein